MERSVDSIWASQAIAAWMRLRRLLGDARRCDMSEESLSGQQWLARWANEPYAYLTTIGRRTSRPHRIEIWFAATDGRIYLLAGGREQSDWVRNIQANAQVTVELGSETRAGEAHTLEPGTVEDQLARELLVTKYQDSDDDLDDWGRTALPVVIEFSI
jgi:deazaflavin-dependent oxidoreductase (nitroreductase family)